MTAKLPRLGTPLPDDTLRLIGEMIIIAALADTDLSNVIGLLEAGPNRTFELGVEGWQVPQRAHHVTRLRSRISDLRNLSAARQDDLHLHRLVREFCWAMKIVQTTRNFFAHGMLAGEPGNQIFWSQRNLKQMSIDDVTKAAPKFRYAYDVIRLINWHLMQIQPTYTLPDRPV